MLKKLYYLPTLIFTTVILSACSQDQADMSRETTTPDPAATGMLDATDDAAPAEDTNPFLVESSRYLKYPPFDRIEDGHYLPAFEQGMAEQLEEIDAIVNQVDAPTFENTLIPMEISGQILSRVSSVFYGMIAAHTNEIGRASCRERV